MAARTVRPEDLRPGDVIDLGAGRHHTIREIRQEPPSITGIRTYRVMAEPAGELVVTYYGDDEVTVIAAESQ